MPETRYSEIYEQGTGQVIDYEPYEVSDEELAQELEDAACQEYLATSPDVITMPQMWYLLRAFAKKLGYISE